MEVLEMGAMQAICLCADDFGLNEGVDDAVLRLVEIDRVHAIGCLVGGRTWKRGALWLRGLPEASVDVGLHLDFTESPLLRGSRRSLRALVARTHFGLEDVRRIRGEVQAQFDEFEDRVGRAPAFVDGHQHVHQLPQLRQALVAELKQRYGETAPWLRSTRRAQKAPFAVKAGMIECLGAAALARLCRDNGIVQNRGLLGVYDFRGGPHRYRELLMRWLQRARHGDLLMCHPASVAVPGDAIGHARTAELAVLRSAELGPWLIAHGLRLQCMSRILRAAKARNEPAC